MATILSPLRWTRLHAQHAKPEHHEPHADASRYSSPTSDQYILQGGRNVRMTLETMSGLSE